MLSKVPGNKVNCETLCGLLSSSINQASSALSLLSLIVSDVSFQAQNVVLSLVSDITVASRLANQLLQQINHISDRETKVHDVLQGLSNLIQKQRLKISQLTDKPHSSTIGTTTDETYFKSNCIKCEDLINVKVINGMLEESLNISSKRIMELEENISSINGKLENKVTENLRLAKGICRYKNLLREAQIVIESQQDLIDSYKRRDSHSPRTTTKKKSKMIDPFIDYRSSGEINSSANLDNKKEPSSQSSLPRTSHIEKHPTIISRDVWSRYECGDDNDNDNDDDGNDDDDGNYNSFSRLNIESIPPKTNENVNNNNNDEKHYDDANASTNPTGNPKVRRRSHNNRPDYYRIHDSTFNALDSKSPPVEKLETKPSISSPTTLSWKSDSYQIIDNINSRFKSAVEPNVDITSSTTVNYCQPEIKDTSSSFRYPNPDLDSYLHSKFYQPFINTTAIDTDEQWNANNNNNSNNNNINVISKYSNNMKLEGNPISSNNYSNSNNNSNNNSNSNNDDDNNNSNNNNSNNDIDSTYTNFANVNDINSQKENYYPHHHHSSKLPLFTSSDSSSAAGSGGGGDDIIAATKSSWGSVDCVDDSFSLIQKYYQPSGIT